MEVINDYQINTTKLLVMSFALTVIFGGQMEKTSNKNMDILKPHFSSFYLFIVLCILEDVLKVIVKMFS